MHPLMAPLGLLAFLAMSQGAAAAVNDDVAQLQALENKFATAFANKDVAAMMSLYAPGNSLFVFDVVGPPGAYSSWDAYREAWTHFFAMFKGPVHSTISNLHIETSGDIGYGRSLQHVSGVRKDGKTYDITARVTDVFRKIDGKWLIVQEHASLPIDRDTFKPILHASAPK